MRNLMLLLFFVAGSNACFAQDRLRTSAEAIKTSMGLKDATAILLRAKAVPTKRLYQVGYLPGDSETKEKRPIEKQFLIEKDVMLTLHVDQTDNKISWMSIEMSPPTILGRGNYFEAICKTIIFHDDRSYSLRLQRQPEDESQKSSDRK